MMETEKYDVWTYNENEEWTDRNVGIADMRLCHGQSRDGAERLAARLAERYPADTFEVRDYQDTTIAVMGTERPDLMVAKDRRMEGRKRRPLGSRGA